MLADSEMKHLASELHWSAQHNPGYVIHIFLIVGLFKDLSVAHKHEMLYQVAVLSTTSFHANIWNYV